MTSPRRASPLSQDLLGAEAGAGGLSSAWEGPGLRRGRLWGRETKPRGQESGAAGGWWPHTSAVRPRTVHGPVAGVTPRPASGVPRRRARGQLGLRLGGWGAAPQTRLLPEAAVASALQDHLRERRGAQRALEWGRGRCAEEASGPEGRGWRLGAPYRGGGDTRRLRAGLLPAPGAARHPPASTHGPGSGTCREPARRVLGQRGRAASGEPLRALQPTATPSRYLCT